MSIGKRKLDAISKVNALLSVTIDSLICNEITDERANTINNLAGNLTKGLEIEELGKRIEKLEKHIED